MSETAQLPTPDTPNPSLTIRIPQDLRQRIDEIAAREDRTASSVVRYYLGEALGMSPQPTTETE